MQIRVRVFATAVFRELPGPGGPGKRFAFSDDLLLLQYDNLTPGNGLPQSELQRRAGSHSGFVTTLRVAAAGDNFYQPGSYLLQYEGIYRFNTVPNTPLQRGQVTARGVAYGLIPSAGVFNPLEPPIRFAITGGTDAYERARGEVIELQNQPNDRELNIPT
jgi:hypothetical protein